MRPYFTKYTTFEGVDVAFGVPGCPSAGLGDGHEFIIPAMIGGHKLGLHPKVAFKLV